MLASREEREKEKIYEEAHEGNLEFVRQKIEEDGSWISKEDSNGRLVIHWACLSSNQQLVQYLLDKGSSVSQTDDIGMTPLILAASAGRLEACRMLVGRGACVDDKNGQGHSALQYAASKGHDQIVKLLLMNEADINIADERGATALHRAASKGMSSVVQLLLEFGKQQIHIDATDRSGDTPLHLSCEENRIQECVQLIRHGAKLDIKNKRGLTPLQLASPQLEKTIRDINKTMT